MKSNLLFILKVIVSLTLLSSGAFCVKLKVPRDLEASWKDLFLDPQRKEMSCQKVPESKQTPEQKAAEAEEKEAALGGEFNMPRKKPNHYAKSMIGWGPSAYLFDYIDGVMQNSITTTFQRIYQEALKLPVDSNFKDPYSLESIAQSKGTPEELVKKIESLSKGSDGKSSFDYKIWQKSISVAQIDKIISEWKWFAKKSVPNPAKHIVDKYDFNGDGRLSPREFILAMIRVNKLVAPQLGCKNCMEEIIHNNIDAMFMYIDCQNEEKINAENLFTNIQKVKTKNCEFFKCNTKGNPYRTSTCNDFIVKAKKSMDGYVNKSEFRMAVLMGYWMRQVDDEQVFLSNEMNMKALRWDETFQVDKVCLKLGLNSGK